MRRLMKNKPAVVGMILIAFAVFLAIFGHVIAPDHTPNTDDQVLEIATESPGFTIDMLYKHKNKSMEQGSIVKLLLSGRENMYQMIPVKEWRIEGGNVMARIYEGSRTGSVKDTAISLADMLYPISSTNSTIQAQNGQLLFTDVSGKSQTISITEAQKRVESSQIRSRSFILGTDKYGRDNLSRLILGIRVSLSVGLIAVLISLLIGITLGAIAGYFRGWVDDFIMWIINIFWSIPLLLLVFALVLALGREFWQIYVAVGLTMWVEVARVVRGQIMGLRELEYVEAAYSMGFSNLRIIAAHILPNAVGPIVVITAANFATAIIIEAGLSFLGIGVQPPTPSWGTMLNEYYGYIGTSKAFLAIVPGIAIMLLVLAFNLVGNGLRDALDVKTRT